MADSTNKGVISLKEIEGFRDAFDSNMTNRLAQNTVTKNGQIDSILRHDRLRHLDHEYSIRIDSEGSPITSQKMSGRCWLFACLNVLRVPFQKALKIKDFEFSQAYWFFWDKFERFNYVLQQIIETSDLDLDDRLVQHLLNNPCEDGGQYDMIINIVEKYGVVPKSVFPDVSSCLNSRKLKWAGNFMFRGFARELRQKAKDGAEMSELLEMKRGFMQQWYQTLCIHVGTPPTEFDFVYTTTESKNAVVMQNQTPTSFYEYIKETSGGYDIASNVSLVNDPRNSYLKTFTVDRLNNMVGGKSVLYVNVDIATMKNLVIKKLQAGVPVWFGCDFGPFNHREMGVLDEQLFDFETIGISFNLTKEQRLQYSQSCMTHAMVFTGVHMQDDQPVKWRVENSHGKDRGKDGYIVMSDAWFEEYVFQIAVPKEDLPEDVAQAMESEPTVLPRWDPMGTLASN
jgi:bleomycin hydrolase